MKETKFRVWDKKNKKWIKPKFGGDLCVGDDIVIVRDFKPNNNGGYSFDKERIFERIDVKVMRDTGIKDKNGIKIYEGDIVKCGDVGTAIIEDIRKLYNIFEYIERRIWLKIIGNIYENPNLTNKQ